MTKAEFTKLLKANGFNGSKNTFAKHITSDFINPNRIPHSFYVYINPKEKSYSFYRTEYKKPHSQKMCLQLNSPYEKIADYPVLYWLS